MSKRLPLLAAVLLSAVFPAFGQVNTCKLRLADQADNGRGYLLYLEAFESNAAQPCRMSSARLVLALGNNGSFQYAVVPFSNWQQDVTYQAVVTVANGNANVVLNGQQLYSGPLPFSPANNQPVYGNRVIASEGGDTELFWENISTSITNGSNGTTITPPTLALQLFERLRGTLSFITVDPLQPLSINAQFRFVQKPLVSSLTPFVDRYGQSRHASYTEKLTADGQFASRNSDEISRNTTWLSQVDTDVYGAPNSPPWTDQATGYYRVKKINNYWWLLSPEGKPVFFVGLDGVPAIYDPLAASTVYAGRENLFEQLPTIRDTPQSRAYFYNSNLATKYGSAWETSHWQRSLDRLRAWGFSGAGKWKSQVPTGVAPSLPRSGVTPEIPVIPVWTFGTQIGTAPGIDGTVIGFPDVFNPTVVAAFEQFIRNQIGSRTTEMSVVGWSLGNEIHGIVTSANIRAMLVQPNQTADTAKAKMIDHIIASVYGGSPSAAAQAWQISGVTTAAQLYAATLTSVTPSDVNQMREFFERKLHQTYYETIKRVDGNHLYFGFWIVPNQWVSSDDWRIMAEWTDVIGYDHYAVTHNPTLYRDLSQGFDKPIFNGEFSFPPSYGGARGFGTAFPFSPGVATFDDAEAASRYATFLESARQDPRCIGVAFFMYIDQMITGRDAGNPFGFSNETLVRGEQYAFGLVDVTDTPKYTLVEAVRNANRAATGVRLSLTGTPTATLYTVQVTVSGNGSVTGTVPCSSSCITQVGAGTVLNLNAVAGLGATFQGWSGSCLGTGACVIPINGDVSITAVFTGGSGGGGGGTPSGPLQFLPVSPCRLVDTRNANGLLGGPSLVGQTTRSFPLLLSACGLPGNAAAYSLNVTVVPKGTLGYITVFPTGSAVPVVSTLNSVDGRIKANAAVVRAGTNGEVSVFATNDTDIVIDVNGVFIPAGTSLAAQQFYPVTPCRIADTRNTQGAFGGPAIFAGVPRNFQVTAAGCGIPANATAFALNVTAVPLGPLGYVTVWPAGTSQPTVSTLNALTGTITANAAVVPSGLSGTISVFANSTTHLILDITGYFGPPGAANGLNFFSLNPCRVMDTRLPNGQLQGPIIAGGETRFVPVTFGSCNVPSTAQAYSLNAGVIPESSLGYLTLWPTGAAQPTVSTLNAVDGAITSNAAFVPAGVNGIVSAFVNNTTHLFLDINGYFAGTGTN
ncbi:hypothetical protein F183_A03690 [Bryobacterales bacterium F-183]|nr:hypothetical protein F183_A03690 [Bryobacterales bacterium F-183]